MENLINVIQHYIPIRCCCNCFKKYILFAAMIFTPILLLITSIISKKFADNICRSFIKFSLWLMINGCTEFIVSICVLMISINIIVFEIEHTELHTKTILSNYWMYIMYIIYISNSMDLYWTNNVDKRLQYIQLIYHKKLKF